MLTPIEEQFLAQKITGYGAIHLYRLEDYVYVAVERDHKWFPVIREYFDSNFSHIIEPCGIKAIFDGEQGV